MFTRIFFKEGSYTGKGLYDVDAFEAAMTGRVPENALLGHDLFESLYARAALVTDIELLDDYPAQYDAFAKRQASLDAWRLATRALVNAYGSRRVWPQYGAESTASDFALEDFR
ncbi:MAG: hypothetical protein WKF84_00900 [Pyrinomonadaceae bacterium]